MKIASTSLLASAAAAALLLLACSSKEGGSTGSGGSAGAGGSGANAQGGNANGTGGISAGNTGGTATNGSGGTPTAAGGASGGSVAQGGKGGAQSGRGGATQGKGGATTGTGGTAAGNSSTGGVVDSCAGVSKCMAGDSCCPSGCTPDNDSDCSSITTDAIPADRRIDWKAGVPGGIPQLSTVCATVDASKYGDGATDATKAIQSAIDGCAAGQVVMLPAGTYKTSNTLNISKGIVLRGAGPDKSKIQLATASVDAVVRVGSWQDSPAGVSITAGATKGSHSLTVANASSFSPGDVLVVDQIDDPSLVDTGDCTFFKRVIGGQARSLAQIVEVVSKSGSVLEINSPLYMNYTASFKPEVAKLNPRVRNAGIEDLYMTRTSAFSGQGFIVNLVNASNSWVKNVETYKVSGRHIGLWACHHCEVRDSYVHHAWDYNSGANAYGISLDLATTDTLVENNIVYYLNLPVVFSSTGGGNVVGYNYVDDAILGEQPDYQMPDIDSHCSWPHMELIEGNYVGLLMLADYTHGGAGYMTAFRNRATGTHLTVAGAEKAAVTVATKGFFMNLLGNVLWTSGLKGAYEDNACGGNFVFRVGIQPNDCKIDQKVTDTILRHGNFDYSTNTTKWDAKITSKALPPSLYLGKKPAFFGDNVWPFVDPDRDPKVGVLPAKARFDALGKKGP